MLILVNLATRPHGPPLPAGNSDPEEQRTNVLDIKLTKSLTIQNQILVILEETFVCLKHK